MEANAEPSNEAKRPKNRIRRQESYVKPASTSHEEQDTKSARQNAFGWWESRARGSKADAGSVDISWSTEPCVNRERILDYVEGRVRESPLGFSDLATLIGILRAAAAPSRAEPNQKEEHETRVNTTTQSAGSNRVLPSRILDELVHSATRCGFRAHRYVDLADIEHEPDICYNEAHAAHVDSHTAYSEETMEDTHEASPLDATLIFGL